MITRKMKIIQCTDVDFIADKINNYVYAFHLLMKKMDESSDEQFIKRFKERFGLNDIEYTSIVSNVKARLLSSETNDKNKKERIKELEETLKSEEKLKKRDKYKIFNKIAFLKHSIENNQVFGGRALLQKITREYNKGEEKNLELLDSYLKEYKEKRKNIPFFITGEGNRKGNRFFDFSELENGKVVYKPFRGKKINIDFKLPKKFQADFARLAEMAENKEIPISVSVGKSYIYFTFDEERLNGFSVNVVERNLAVKEIKKQGFPKEIEREKIKEIYRKSYEEKRKRKLVGKIEGRCIAVDLNPTNIGFSILDKQGDKDAKLLYCGLFDLKKLCNKLGKSSDSEEQSYQNRKRKYELSMIIKNLFSIAKHYKCSQFIMEDLNGKFKNENKETNRKVKTLWNRVFIENTISRRCNETGIELLKINPCYTSFIGNIKHWFVDATNASIEIGRRGLHYYTEGTFYPSIDEVDFDTMEAKFGVDVQDGTVDNWVNAYKSLKKSFENNKEDFSHRLRTTLGDIPKGRYQVFSMNSHSSRVDCIIFNIMFNKLC